MQVERLIARIRGQLELGTPDLEARSLAGEYSALCQRARERLEQCATLVRSGNEHAAFQAAESDPDLLGLCALLSFAESDRWHAPLPGARPARRLSARRPACPRRRRPLRSRDW